ncbi:MAG: dihydrolipoamide acetyltransferase family protein [Spirochaetaceae bacterium]|nr:dihydrolipoamide acetyltransferase family protein [Spirochaetaceae bacterium]
MATKVIMPKAGMAMEEGIIVSWLKKPGDPVKRGEPIAEIETDKVAMELEAEESGILLAILRGAGEHVAVTETIAWIGDAGEELPASGTGSASAAPATPAARRLAAEAGIAIDTLPLPDSGAIYAEDVRKYIRKDASPLASRLAEAAGIDPSTLASADGQRARKSDAQAAIASRRVTGDPSTGKPTKDRRVTFSVIQRISGERLSRSRSEIPAVTIFAVADATELLEARESINAVGTHRISVNDLAVMACAKALVANPRANSVVDGDGLILKGSVNIGIAVATEAGLLVPTLRDADRLTLAELSRRSKDLADRARSRRLRPEELEEGTFTVSNIGMYGVTHFTPIINQPQVGILGIGGTEDRLALGPAGMPVVRKVLPLSFTFDHRALDGIEASAFVKSVKDLIERPLLILI